MWPFRHSVVVIMKVSCRLRHENVLKIHHLASGQTALRRLRFQLFSVVINVLLAPFNHLVPGSPKTESVLIKVLLKDWQKPSFLLCVPCSTVLLWTCNTVFVSNNCVTFSMQISSRCRMNPSWSLTLALTPQLPVWPSFAFNIWIRRSCKQVQKSLFW